MEKHEVNRYAGLGTRSCALLVDLALLFSLFTLITRIVKGAWIMSVADHGWAYGPFITDPLCVAFLGAMFLYFPLFEGLAGATPGKWALGLRVMRGAVRSALRLVDGLPALGILGIILILRSGERARFGDRVAGTRVVWVR